MFIRTTMLAAAAAIGFAAAPVSAATYTATSQLNNKGNAKHSVGFSKYRRGQLNVLEGAKGKQKRFFLFENSADGAGKFEVNGNTATLTGIIRNAAGQGYEMTVNYELTSDPGVYANRRGASTADWSFYKMTSGSLVSLTDGLKSFDLAMRGKKWNGTSRSLLAGQFGTGANNKNVDMMGLFTKLKATEQGCVGSMKVCEKYNLVMKLALSLDPLAPSEGTLADSDAAVVPLPAAALMLPAALGVFGISGAIGRRRKG